MRSEFINYTQIWKISVKRTIGLFEKGKCVNANTQSVSEVMDIARSLCHIYIIYAVWCV